MIENVHTRQIPDSAHLVDRLVELWPSDRWPALVLDRPLGVGADGGHGFVRYHCTHYVPGQRVEFAFSPGLDVVGTHVLEAVPGGLRHTLAGRPRGLMRLWWPLAVRWLHDALIEDLLDNAARAAGHPPVHPARWSAWVRLLRAAAERSARQPA
ncbi:SRPBCC family protein [Saccharothrix deserti]|uniref:SRPBCC family protein n=1 Tax=Saccharothrix deserti TaxID=2593674 RepID=UPI00131EA10E|nr:SRPBCC family protein [Saccharothrix deserti]